ncbi:hypothetical protein V7068_14795 [Bacillus sp. JJ634]
MKKVNFIFVVLSILFFCVNSNANAKTIQEPKDNEIILDKLNKIENTVKELKNEDKENSIGWVEIVTALAAIGAALIAYAGNKKTIKASKESSERSNEISRNYNDIYEKSNEISEKLGNLAAETQSKQRLIEVVSTQRVEWINKVRENFSLYSQQIHKIALIRSNNKALTDDLLCELTYLDNLILLLLNPREVITKNFIKHKKILSKYVLNDKGDFRFEEYSKMIENLHFIEQVILKSEWGRLKIESMSGSEVKNMEKIHKETAEDIDPEKYNLFLKKEYENIRE